MPTEWLKKKRNFTQCETKVLVGEVEARKNILLSGFSVGITNAKHALEQCCQLSDFVTRFSDFSDPFSDFISNK